jgi:hypothetical protein
MGEKCCTKKKNCDSTPTCAKGIDMRKVIGYLIMFNFAIIILRVLLIKKEETASLASAGPFGYIWWYGKFILFLQIQLMSLVFFYQLTLVTFNNLIALLKNMIDALKAFLGIVHPNAFMEWLNMSKVYWWLVKIYYFLLIIWYVFCIFFILGGYLFVVFLFGPYLLGYYKINAYQSRGNSYL